MVLFDTPKRAASAREFSVDMRISLARSCVPMMLIDCRYALTFAALTGLPFAALPIFIMCCLVVSAAICSGFTQDWQPQRGAYHVPSL
jgi:hypothetical protein